MDSVLRGLIIYFILLVIFRISGKRSLAQITTFDFVLLLIISETTQQAMVGDDFSITNAVLLIVTLMSIDIALSIWKQHSRWLDKLIEDAPVLVVEQGRPLKDRMDKERIDETDILASARELRGLERMEQIKYAVLERGGHITIVPKRSQNSATITKK
jgi:uncharacterized membrane protein YcaP (DUF421 family)